jgi:hypothetical protein
MVSPGPKRFAPEPNADEVLLADVMGIVHSVGAQLIRESVSCGSP